MVTISTNNSSPIYKKILILFILLGVIVGFSVLTQLPYLPFLLVGICFFIFLFVEKPELMLIPVIFTSSFLNVIIVHSKVPHNSLAIAGEVNHILLMDIFILISILTIFFGRITNAVKPYRSTSIELLMLALAILAVLSISWARDRSAAFSIVVKFFFCVSLFYVPLFLLKDKKILRWSLWAFLFSGIIAAAVSLTTLYVEAKKFSLFNYEFFSMKDFILELHYFYMENLGPRVSGFTDPNRVASILNMMLFPVLGLFFTSHRKSAKVFILVSLLFILFVDLHSMSKGGLVALLVASTVFVMFNPYFTGKRLRILMLAYAIVVVLLFSILAFSEKGLGRFGRNPIETRSQSSLANRFKWWGEDFKRIYESYGLGTGLGGMSDYNWAYAQSSYFSFLAEFGFLGFLILILLGSIFLKKIYFLMNKMRSNKYYFTITLSFLCALITFAVHSIVDFSYIMRVPWLLAGLLLAVAQLRVNNEEI